MINDLPDPHTPGDSDVADGSNVNQPQTHSAGAGSKELEAVPLRSSEAPLTGVGVETELPREVQSAGVKSQTQSVYLPKKLTDTGITVIESHEPTQQPHVTTQLSDPEIFEGRKQDITSSWKWLSMFHIRQLAKLGLVLRSIQGTIQRLKR